MSICPFPNQFGCLTPIYTKIRTFPSGAQSPRYKYILLGIDTYKLRPVVTFLTDSFISFLALIADKIPSLFKMSFKVFCSATKSLLPVSSPKDFVSPCNVISLFANFCSSSTKICFLKISLYALCQSKRIIV